MTLSDDKLWDLWNAQGTDNMSKEEAFVFARAIEAEVRKQDTELIQQLVEALEWTVAPQCMCWAGCEACHPANPPNPVAAITAGRARLEGKP